MVDPDIHPYPLSLPSVSPFATTTMGQPTGATVTLTEPHLMLLGRPTGTVTDVVDPAMGVGGSGEWNAAALLLNIGDEHSEFNLLSTSDEESSSTTSPPSPVLPLLLPPAAGTHFSPPAGCTPSPSPTVYTPDAPAMPSSPATMSVAVAATASSSAATASSSAVTASSSAAAASSSADTTATHDKKHVKSASRAKSAAKPRIRKTWTPEETKRLHNAIQKQSTHKKDWKLIATEVGDGWSAAACQRRYENQLGVKGNWLPFEDQTIANTFETISDEYHMALQSGKKYNLWPQIQAALEAAHSKMAGKQGVETETETKEIYTLSRSTNRIKNRFHSILKTVRICKEAEKCNKPVPKGTLASMRKHNGNPLFVYLWKKFDYCPFMKGDHPVITSASRKATVSKQLKKSKAFDNDNDDDDDETETDTDNDSDSERNHNDSEKKPATFVRQSLHERQFLHDPLLATDRSSEESTRMERSLRTERSAIETVTRQSTVAEGSALTDPDHQSNTVKAVTEALLELLSKEHPSPDKTQRKRRIAEIALQSVKAAIECMDDNDDQPISKRQKKTTDSNIISPPTNVDKKPFINPHIVRRPTAHIMKRPTAAATLAVAATAAVTS